MSRPILAWEGCLNSRDVGGLPVAGGGHIRWNSLIRTHNLGYLNASGIEKVRAHGVSRINDLRFPGESAAGAAEVGPHPFIDGGIYCSIPTETMLRLLEHLERRYGGAAGYLRTHGLDESIVSALRDRLTSNV